MEDQGFTRIKEVKKLLSSNFFEIGTLDYKVKPIRPGKSHFEKKILASLKNNKDRELEQKFLYKEELRKLLFGISEVRELPATILKLPPLKSFESCHVLVHEKGKPVGQNYLALHGENVETTLIGVQNFNSLFNLVKKSKNKIFNQSISLKDDLAVVGNFLAKEIDLKNYSVIYLISRNSFLPPSAEEQFEFQALSAFLHPLLIKILDKEKNDLKKEVLRKSLENFPEKITIKKAQQIIFSNKVDNSDYENSNLMIFPLEVEDNTTMELSNFKKDQISTELYHSQRVSLLGELLNTLQHELSNPLFGLNLTSSILENESDNPEVKETLKEISQNAHRSQTIIKNFSNLYNDQQEFKRINLYRFVEEVLTLTKSETKEIAKTVQYVGFNPQNESTDLEITTSPTYLTQIIFNLVINAAQAIKEHGSDFRKNSIIIKLTKLTETVEIAIIDDGPGVNSDHLATIFQPFFTTKDSGTGLGLSICQNLAHQLGTKIEFKNNSPLLGATFSINLPL
ncbi:MAG: HAMP domain-containing histidine kinase [Bdellovibrionales bacterium]|nr:HAMP domain-containing histidine kinase [Bdellovibrionales bacterium]